MRIFWQAHLVRIRRLAQFIFFFLLLVISYIAFLPNYNSLPELTSVSDILNHFMAFFVLAIFLDMGFCLKYRYAFALLLLYGFFIESVQYFLPNRDFSLLDIVVDMAGLLAYYICLLFFKTSVKKRAEGQR